MSGWFDYKVAHSKANERIQELIAMDEQDKAALKQFKSDLIETQDALKKSEADLEGVNLLLESSNLLTLENQNALEESQANLVENQNALEESQANLVESQNALEESEANLLDSQKELSEKVRTLAESGDGGAADKSLAAALKELELDLFESQNELKDTKKALDTANNEIRTLKEGSDTGIALQDAGDLAWKMLEKPQTLLLSSGKNAGGFAKPALNASQLALHTLREQCAVSADCELLYDIRLLTVRVQVAYEDNRRFRKKFENYLGTLSGADRMRIVAEASIMRISAAAKARENLIRNCELLWDDNACLLSGCMVQCHCQAPQV